HVHRHVPPVVLARCERHAHLADDLRPHVQGGIGVLPGGQRERRPGAGHLRRRLRGAHRPTLSWPVTARRLTAPPPLASASHPAWSRTPPAPRAAWHG